jgi:hypothetical protein
MVAFLNLLDNVRKKDLFSFVSLAPDDESEEASAGDVDRGGVE